MNTAAKWVRVWDPIVRLGHWTLVAAFFTAYLTEDDFLTVHVWAGYVLAGVVTLRLLWGLIGTRHARFSDFVRSPLAVLRYMGDMARGRARRYVGHNPAGAAMIVALLASLTVTAASGLVLYAYEEGAGPLAPMLVETAPAAAVAADGARSRDEYRHRENEAEEVWEEIHEIFANLTLLLVVLHVAGVVLSSLAHRENLIRAMITGRKRKDAQA